MVLPKTPFVKIHFDGSVVNEVAARGFIIRNAQGNPIIAGVLNLGENTIFVADALALREAMRLNKRKRLNHIIVKGDSKLIIDVILYKWAPWRLRTIIDDIRSLATSFYFISWSHVFHEVNFFADTITK